MGGRGSGRRHGASAAPNVVSLTTTPPPPPRGLSKASRRLWTEILTTHEADATAQAQLMAALHALDRAESCRAKIHKEGLTINVPNGGLRPHPLVRIQQNAERFANDVFKALGLTR